MKLLSINVSLPKEFDWQGRKILTSIMKMPVEGRRKVHKLNIEGDAQSDLQAHGGEHRAVFLYQQESYDYWAELLGRDDFHYGQFGENLTIDGLADSDVCIGDRLQINTVILEVTQPRVTCYKVAFSTGVERMPALLVSHKRPGFYCRVIREGDIQAGDEIIRLSRGEEGMSIVEVDGSLYSNAHPIDRLRLALGNKALSTGWRYSLQALYDAAATGNASGNAGLAPPATIAAWPGFVPFIITNIVTESDDVRSFELTPFQRRLLPEFIPGQHIVIKIPNSSQIRMYSLCGPPNATSYRIGVKREPDGFGSNYLHGQLKLNDQVEITAPRGTFTLTASTRPLILIGAGIGITPLLAMLYAVKDQRKIFWIYTTQNKAHYPFESEVQRLSTGLTDFHSQTLFTRPQTNEPPNRLTPEKLKQQNLPMDGDFYLCGPPGFMAEISVALQSLGIPPSSIKQESFGGPTQPATTSSNASPSANILGARPPHLPAGPQGAGPLITFARTGLSFNWHPRFHSLLEAAEAADVPTTWSCRVGVCHRCETTLFAGGINYTTPPLDSPTPGNILLCCSTPSSDCQLDL